MNRQEIAARHFLPFCRSLLLGAALPSGSARLPLRTPEALTAEVITALEDMINKAVMGWLIRGVGWRALSVPDEDEVLTARIWDEDVWGSLRLTFTARSVDVLLLAWNLLVQSSSSPPAHSDNRRWKRMSTSQRAAWKKAALQRVAASHRKVNREQITALSVKHSGDLLLHHLVFRRLYRRQAVLPSLWMHNPLNLMAFHTHGGQHTPESCSGFAGLLRGPLAPLMPWISAEWPDLWKALPEAASLEDLSRMHHNQAVVFTAWIQACEESDQPHLLVPLIQHYHHLMQRLEGDRAQLAQLTSRRPLSIRQPAARQWAAALMPLSTIHAHHQDALRTHPIDREGSQRILLSEAARLKLPALHTTTQAAALALNDSIG